MTGDVPSGNGVYGFHFCCPQVTKTGVVKFLGAGLLPEMEVNVYFAFLHHLFLKWRLVLVSTYFGFLPSQFSFD